MSARFIFVHQKLVLRLLWLFVCAALWFAAVQTASAQPLQIINHPQSKNVSVGESVSFQVDALGTLPIFFQWKRNGVNIPGATNSSVSIPASDNYVIQSVQPNDCGNYNVVVFNKDGAVDSEVATLLATNIPFAPASDSFANRVILGQVQGGMPVSFRATNLNATAEPGEPPHGFAPGGASVWFSFLAPPGGSTIRVDTRGSGFDTTLGVFQDNGSTNLPVALPPGYNDDDSGGFYNSSVIFSAPPLQRFAIVVDGFYGDMGNIVVNITAGLPPLAVTPAIITPPQDQTVSFGSTATTFFTTDTNGFSAFQWYRNSTPVTGTNDVQNGTTNGSLVISNFNPDKVGQYQALVFYGEDAIFTPAGSLQLNFTDGSFNPNSGARRKFRSGTDLIGSGQGFRPVGKGGKSGVAPAGGFTGTQVFSTVGAAKEPGEPNHCGEAGGASCWFSYQAPAGGTLSIDTTGTGFDNVLAVYTGPNPITNFSDLVSVACSSTNGMPGDKTAVLPVASNALYYIVSDGVGGAMGTVQLNYNLSSPPAITTQPTNRMVSAGASSVFVVGATGTPALNYQWQFNSTNIANATSSSFTVTNAQAANAGSYTVVVTNSFGSVTSLVATLTVNGPPLITIQPTSQTVLISNNITFVVAAIGTPVPRYQWRFNATNNLAGATNAMLTVTNAMATNAGSYTALATNSFGSATSSVATLTVNIPPAISSHPQSQTVAPGSNVALIVVASGIPAPNYRWRKNGVAAPSRTNSSTTITNFQSSDQADYDVVVTNVVGAVTSSTAILYLNSPVRFTNLTRQLNVYFSALLIGSANTNYVIDYSENTTNWSPIRTNSSATGLINFSDTNVLGHPQRIYRASPQ